MEKLFGYLILKGGKIVSSNDCSTSVIDLAKGEGRMWVNENGFGFIYLSE